MNESKNIELKDRNLRRLGLCVLIAVVLMAMGSAKAQTIVNGDFEGGTTGWSGCINEIGTAPTYGGSGTGRVAEVDGNFDPGPADDRILCQTVSGFTVGSAYALAFDATRRGNGTPPSPVAVTITINGGALSTTVSRTGGYSMQRQYLNFTATQTTHSLTITPNFTSSYGMIFDNMAITTASSLPVELLHFDARTDAGGVELEWTTATEQNNAYFVVERSRDAMEWEGLQRVDGAGNSVLPLHYVAQDPEPLTGIAYYRLQQVDNDGIPMIPSRVKAVQFGVATRTLIWPNPASDNVHLTVFDAVRGVQVLDSMGRNHVVPQSGPPEQLSLDLSDLPTGQYVVRSNNDGSVLGRFVKR